MITLDQAIDTVMQLPPEQREMLIDILHNRYIEERRNEIADDAQKSLAAFRAGSLKLQSANEVITELRESLDDSPQE